MTQEKETKNRILLQPDPNCPNCHGRGYLRTIPPHLNANIYRRVVPCFCVGAVAKLSELENSEISVQI